MARFSEHDLILAEYQLQRQLILQEGRDSMSQFVLATDMDYEWNWHHHLICQHLDKVLSGDITRLIITMPPRHGKSELVSRKFPAFYLGHNPDDLVIMISHSDKFSSKFNRATQKIMRSSEYRAMFPASYLNQVNPDTMVRPVANNKGFEMPLTDGQYLSAGYMAGVTGEGANLLLIDDPIKNSEEAFSDSYREKLWDEWKNTIRTRVMPGGRVIICLTRWHEDDLVGRLIEKMNDPTDEHAENWTILTLEAIKETEHDYDPRQLGEALWPAWYPLAELLKFKSAGEEDFSALFQQAPTMKGGNMVEESWFRYYNKRDVTLPIPDFWVDAADKTKPKNDRTAILGGVKLGNDLYLTHGAAIRAKFPQRVAFIVQTVADHGDRFGSLIRVEPKSSGQSIIDTLKEDTDLNVIEGRSPTEKKEVRLNAVSPRIKGGRVYLPEGEAWVREFLKEVTGFPKQRHDDYVDCLIEAIQDTLGGYQFEMDSHNYGSY